MDEIHRRLGRIIVPIAKGGSRGRKFKTKHDTWSEPSKSNKTLDWISQWLGCTEVSMTIWAPESWLKRELKKLQNLSFRVNEVRQGSWMTACDAVLNLKIWQFYIFSLPADETETNSVRSQTQLADWIQPLHTHRHNPLQTRWKLSGQK